MSKKEVLLYKITIMLSVERAESWAAKEIFYPKYNFIFIKNRALRANPMGGMGFVLLTQWNLPNYS
jgi:hypothetical protein